MKKKYIKPYIAVESFQLDAAIAVSCSSQGYIPIGRTENTCGMFDSSEDGFQFELFNYNNCATDLTGPSGDGNDTPCYHGPYLANATFIAS